jgi:D-serine deaminase-like pyridoxal phosphate-dependent protein
MRAQAWLLGVFLLATACAGPKITVNGIEVYQAHWDQAREEIGRRARFEMKCEQLAYALLHRVGRYPTEVAVEGCGRRALYVRPMISSMHGGAIGSWQLSSISDAPAPAPRPSPSPGSSL